MLIHRKLQGCLNQLKRQDTGPDIRRNAELLLQKLLMLLVDNKIRHGLSHSEELHELASTLRASRPELAGTAAVLADHFGYRLAHIAMRSRQWKLAVELLDQVIESCSALGMARLYRAVCTSKLTDSKLDVEQLATLAQELVATVPTGGPGPLDLAVQDPLTNMAELFLIMQDAPDTVIDALYDTEHEDALQRGLTAGLTLLLAPDNGSSIENLVMCEWLAMRHLDELKAEGWLVVDAMAPRGMIGRGTAVKHLRGEPNKPQLTEVVQVMGMHAPQSLTLRELKKLFKQQEEKSAGQDGEAIGQSSKAKKSSASKSITDVLDRAPGGIRIDTGGMVIENENGIWNLKRPYVVIMSDARRTLHQSLPSCQ